MLWRMQSQTQFPGPGVISISPNIMLLLYEWWRSLPADDRDEIESLLKNCSPREIVCDWIEDRCGIVQFASVICRAGTVGAVPMEGAVPVAG
jgi:hypothetical protein